MSSYYLITIFLLMYLPFITLNQDTALMSVRLSVLIILFLALELKFGFISQMIRKPKAKYFDLN